MEQITALIRDIIIIVFVLCLIILIVLGYLKISRLFSKVDSLVDNSQKLWSLMGYMISPIDKINSKSLEMIVKYIKSLNVEKATKTAKKATKTATDKIRRKSNE
jgi:predicted PurR-regulated permease PerM